MEMRTQKQQLPDIGWKINKKLLHLGGKNIIGEVNIKAGKTNFNQIKQDALLFCENSLTLLKSVVYLNHK